MISSYDMMISLRVYLEEKFGLPTVIRTKGWKIPSTNEFLTVYNPSSSHLNLSKNKELVDVRVQLEIGCFGSDVRSISKIFNDINKEIMYGVVPLLDINTGDEIGAFSFEGIDIDSDFIGDDVPIENDVYKHRRYVVASTKLAYIKHTNKENE